MTDHPDGELSQREQEVAAAYADGKSYKEIAQILGLSPATVRTHLRTIYRKLSVTSKIELSLALKADAAPTVRTNEDNATLVAELALELDEAMRRERVLDPAVEALHHSVRLRPHWRGEAMLDPQLSAEVIKLVRAGGGTAAEAKETVGEFLCCR